MNELQELYDEMMDNYNQLKSLVRDRNQILYERWKAGGFLIDDDIMSMYPTLGKVIEKLEENDNE